MPLISIFKALLSLTALAFFLLTTQSAYSANKMIYGYASVGEGMWPLLVARDSRRRSYRDSQLR